ncbi:sodium- and chloride-dependent GABA transporter 3-like [Liolophura sinensis]|uniref:sodium- and chloride-dependent GABA transporter 3-like n=1 Tax=Liolophura sinensis TaxID=3198878 RepID=UPI003158D49B
MCFRPTPPWTTCGHEWNTEGCIPIWDVNGTINVNASSNRIMNTTGGRASMLATEEFWTYNVLDLSRGFEFMGTLKWELALAVTISWTLVFICLCKGVFSSRIAVYITAPAPFILLTILLIRASLLPGSLDGVLFYVTPDWDGLKSYQVWVEGFIYGFYSLGNGYGAVTTLGSYNRFHDQSLGNSIIISIADLLAAIYCGFALFTILGYMAYETGIPVSEIRNSGPGLIFITYPHTASLLPLPQLWTVLFFLTCILLAVDSQFGAFKTLTSGLCDLYPGTLGKHKVLVCLAACVGGNLLGLIFITQGGMYYFQVVDWYSAALGTTTISFFEGLAIAWVYGADNFCENIKEMMPTLPNRVLKVLKFHWKFVLPVICLVVLSITLWRFKPPTLNDYSYPDIAQTVGWVIATGIVLPIPAAIVYGLFTTQGSLMQRFKHLSAMRYDSFVKHSCDECKEKSYFSDLPLDKTELEMCHMLPDVFQDDRA